MADTQLVDMTEVTQPADADLLYLYDADIADNAKVQVKNLLHLGSGQISVTGGAAGQTLVAATWTKVAQFTAESSGTGATASHANDKIQAANTGLHIAFLQLSFTASAAATLELAIYWDGVLQQQLKLTTPDSGTTSAVLAALVNAATAPKDFEVWVKDSAASADFVVSEGQFIVTKVS